MYLEAVSGFSPVDTAEATFTEFTILAETIGSCVQLLVREDSPWIVNRTNWSSWSETKTNHYHSLIQSLQTKLASLRNIWIWICTHTSSILSEPQQLRVDPIMDPNNWYMIESLTKKSVNYIWNGSESVFDENLSVWFINLN